MNPAFGTDPDQHMLLHCVDRIVVLARRPAMATLLGFDGAVMLLVLATLLFRPQNVRPESPEEDDADGS